MKKTSLLFLFIIGTATFGAGLADMLTDVIPFRPYTEVFHFTPIEAIGRSTVLSDIVIVTLVVALISTLIVAVANRTTGIIISHAGGPAVNANLSGSPGIASVIPLLPLVFSFIGLFFISRSFKNETAGI